MIRLAEPSQWNVRLLSRVYEKYPDEYPLEEWFEEILEGRAFLFEQSQLLPTIDYAGIVQIEDTYIQARVGGGIDGRMKVLEMFNFLKFMAHVYDKEYIRLKGRRGWWKHLRELGFRQIQEIKPAEGGSRPSYVYEVRR